MVPSPLALTLHTPFMLHPYRTHTIHAASVSTEAHPQNGMFTHKSPKLRRARMRLRPHRRSVALLATPASAPSPPPPHDHSRGAIQCTHPKDPEPCVRGRPTLSSRPSPRAHSSHFALLGALERRELPLEHVAQSRLVTRLVIAEDLP